ncbi:periplasmic binding protein-like I [Obelidium mucronatum]|nr:periplasmic binding protein-like I [Obelidium mucronatum]
MNLVTGGYDRMNIEFLSDPKEYGPWQSFYWIQRAGQIMVDAINLTPTILPNTTIKIKRFDTFSPWTGLYSGGSVIGTAMDIAENHKDVVAVFGEFYAEFSIYSAQVYSMFQLPFCGPYQNSYSLLDRHKYPYYFQAKSISGQGNAVASLLSSWNVTRVAVIAEGLFNRKSSICAQYMESFQDMKIEIVAVITGASIYTIEETYRTLKSVDARYILICAGPSKTADIYYSLTITKKMQSSEYVWLSHNPLIPRSLSRAIKLWGPGYYRASQGIIMAQPFNPPTPKMTNLLAVYMQTLNDIQSPWTTSFLTPKR